MGLFDETAKAIPGQDVGDTSTSGLGSLAAKAIQKAVDEGVINPNVTTTNTPLSDLRSIIVRDPSIVDPSFDISGVRTTTPTRSELLAAVPEFSGFEYDPTQRSYIEDLYALYGGAVPTVDVAQDTAQIPGAIDTLVDVGGGGGMDQVTGGSVLDTTPTNTQFEQNLLDQGIGVQGAVGDPVVAPGEMPLTQDDFDDFNKIAVTPQTFADTGRADLLNQAGNVPGVGFATDFFPDIDTNVGTTKPTATFGDTTTGLEDYLEGIDPATGQAETPSVAFERPTIADVTGPITLSRQDVIDTDANVGFVDAPTLEAEDVDISGNLLESGINKIKNLIPDFDPLITAGKLALNAFVGKPVSLVIDALRALPSEDPADTLNRDIVDELKAEKDYGFNIQSGNLNQDPFGRNPVSLFGNYEQTLLNDATSTGTTKIDLAKKEFAQDYFDKKAGKTAPQEDIGSVSEDISLGGENIVDEFKPSDIQPTDPSLEITDRGRGDSGGGQDTGPSGPPSGPGEASADAGFDSGPSSDGPYGGGPGGVQSDIGGGSVSTGGPPSQGGSSGGPPSQGGGGGGGGGDGCFLKGTQVTMADGSTKAIEQVDLGDKVAKGGKVFATGKFLVENLHDYKGVKVSGSHMVSEDGNWVRVEDSKHGKPLGDDEHTVYVFGSENRRILINGITFTDYFEVNEQDKLLNNEKDFFNNWKNYASKDSQNNVEIINAI